MPETITLVNVPTDVMFGCAFVVTVPAVVADPALVAYVALATSPVILAPVIPVSACPFPMILPTVTFPVVVIVLLPYEFKKVATLLSPYDPPEGADANTPLP